MTPTEAEIRATLTEYIEREWRIDNNVLDYLTDDIDPLAVIVDHSHVNDDDFDVWSDARRAAIEARREALDAALRPILVEAETEAVVAFLARFPWAPLAEREAVPA